MGLHSVAGLVAQNVRFLYIILDLGKRDAISNLEGNDGDNLPVEGRGGGKARWPSQRKGSTTLGVATRPEVGDKRRQRVCRVTGINAHWHRQRGGSTTFS